MFVLRIVYEKIDGCQNTNGNTSTSNVSMEFCFIPVIACSIIKLLSTFIQYIVLIINSRFASTITNNYNICSNNWKKMIT